MTTQLFQTLFIFLGLAITLLLSAVWKAKAECTCRVKVPMTFVALVTSIVIGVLFGFTDLNYIISGFLFLLLVGSILYPKVEYAGPALYLAGFIGIFAGFQIAGIHDVFNIGLENISIFGALIAIIIMFLKKQDNVTTIYIVGMSLFFITASTTIMLPLIIASVLITLSEVMLIYFKEEEETASDEKALDIGYFSAGLYSFGVCLIPLVLL